MWGGGELYTVGRKLVCTVPKRDGVGSVRNTYTRHSDINAVLCGIAARSILC